jgi:hypothetical protein
MQIKQGKGNTVIINFLNKKMKKKIKTYNNEENLT